MNICICIVERYFNFEAIITYGFILWFWQIPGIQIGFVLFAVGLRLYKEPVPEKTEETKEVDSKPEAEPKGEEAPADTDVDKEKDGADGDVVDETEQKTAEPDVVEGETNSQVIDRLCKYVYSNGLDRVRTRAMLCHIYNHALHDRFYEARDLMLISHLQEEIQHSDIPTQVS